MTPAPTIDAHGAYILRAGSDRGLVIARQDGARTCTLASVQTRAQWRAFVRALTRGHDERSALAGIDA